MPLPDLIAGTAERFAGKTALIYLDQSITFVLCTCRAGRLQRVCKGSASVQVRAVAILHENALAPVIFFWGVLASGAQWSTFPAWQASRRSMRFWRSVNRPQ